MYYGKAEAVVGIDYQDLTRQDVEEKPTGTYLWRVLVVNTHHSAPHLFELRDHDQKLVERLVSIQLWKYAWVTSYPRYDYKLWKTYTRSVLERWLFRFCLVACDGVEDFLTGGV